jgi:dihydrodipicolinate synthase/N-acetylneuraminate lyase
MRTLSGVFPIVPTVFTRNGRIDVEATLGVVDYIVACKSAGVVFPGLASEYDMLSNDERVELGDAIGQRVAGRMPFIVGASAQDRADVFDLVKAGAAAGAVAAMVLTPREHVGDLPAMIAFYADACQRGGIPIMIQNAPPPMGSGLSLDKIAAIARAVPNVRFVKEEAQPSGQRITQLTELAGTDLDGVFGGAGARYVMDELRRGARGTMPACEITEVHVAMLAAYADGDIESARVLFERTLPLLSMPLAAYKRSTQATRRD